ncbi:MAG: hypothetical protein GY954_03295, partial [Alteromonas sp.]|nr:hypothetical protein [Alteromonas sp.]
GAAYIFIRFNDKLRASAQVRGAILSLAILLLAGGAAMEFASNDPAYFKSRWNMTFISFGFSALTLWGAVTSVKLIRPLKLVSGYLAKLSYTIYLYHLFLVAPVLGFVFTYVMVVDSALSYFTVFIIYCVAVVVTSAVIYFIVDRPSMNYRRSLFKE